MTAAYMFPHGLATLARHIRPDTLFAFDLDGTLAPIVTEYADARIDEPVRRTLSQLAQYATVAVITGRSRQNALAMIGFEPHLTIGCHGAEWPEIPEPQRRDMERCCTAWKEQLHRLLGRIEGIELEDKGVSLSLHYRKAADRFNALGHIDSAVRELTPQPRVIGGKCVVNLTTSEAFTKGEALMAAMSLTGAVKAIYFGDDETDEEVFRLQRIDLVGIHIGTEGRTAAPYYLENQSEVLGLLTAMVGILENQVMEENTVAP